MGSRALFLVNARSRRGADGADDIARRLGELGLDVIVEPGDDPASFAERIGRHRQGVDRVIVGGGDGTLNAAVQALVPTGLPLGVVPLGTANNLARTLGIPFDVAGACQVIAAGHRRRVDLGSVNGRYFLTTANLGLSATITEELSAGAKRTWGPLAYIVTTARVLRRAHPFHAEVVWNGGSFHTRTVQIVVGNGRYYGPALAVAEDATMDDARLDFYSLEVKHWWELLKLAPSLKRGTHGRRQEVEALGGHEFLVRTRRPMALVIDGEPGGETPARFRVVPRAMEVFTPAADEGAR